MNVAIVGYGVEGRTNYDYWKARGASITICDEHPAKEIPAGAASQLGPDYLQNLGRFDVIVRSAGVNPHKIINANPGIDIAPRITTAINEFLRVCPTKNVIGITGSKGKGTTSALTAKILEASGRKVFLGGNIGVSPLTFLREINPDDWVVLELSSFQLYDLKRSPHIGVCLMVVPEHLNWHSDMNDYIAAKSQLFAHQSDNDIAIYFADNEISHRIASNSPGKKITYFAQPGAYVADDHIVIDNQQICHVNELKLLGDFNWQNACAAATVAWQITNDITPLRAVLTLFSGLEHRLEFVRETGGIKYYDDSFGTVPEAAMVAIDAFKEPKVLILGGSDKGADFTDLAKKVTNSNVRHVITIGMTAPAIEAALLKAGYSDFSRGGATMPDIVAAATAEAKSGDVVLLSPACASFGLFKDYKDRGYQFKLAVGAL